MEPNDEVVERQKLVDVETEEDVTNSAPKSAPTPASPMAVPKINIKSMSSGETTRSRNSASCSIERATTTSEKIGGVGSGGVGQSSSAKVTYVNERRPRPQLHGTNDERFEFKSRPRKLLKDNGVGDDSINGIMDLSNENLNDETSIIISNNLKKSQQYNNYNNNNNTVNKPPPHQKQQHHHHNHYTTATSTSSLNQPSASASTSPSLTSQQTTNITNTTTITSKTTITADILTAPIGSNTQSSNANSSDSRSNVLDFDFIASCSSNNNTSSSSNSSNNNSPHQHKHHKNNNNNNINNNNNNNHNNIIIDNTPLIQRRKPNVNTATFSVSAGYPGLISSANIGSLSDKFDQRPIKHHSFVSEVPDVKHMERALLGLLDDFHSGKLKAFGSGCTMDQMTKIREQQESLAKLHFELAAAEEDSLENGNDFNAAKAQENMLQLMQRLEQLSISIEQLQTSHTGL